MGVENSPKRQQRHAAFLKRQEKRWAKRSGPVVVRQVDPATLKPGQPLPRSPRQPTD